ncbi:MAG: hypothetical protein COV66_02345 [Nitrospinae bacterium CG11_big_fil_rev_8_21_14_0_20_45_15]|nr:MAG: hypothetical protein COV66_02345 [Nitrospinae bacterium CG11_big_fil_rev_8_21_14_0_20_45_15]
MGQYLELAQKALEEKRRSCESPSPKQLLPYQKEENQISSDSDIPRPIASVYPEPYFRENGSLVIPSNSNPRYHWWNGGMLIEETIAELKSRKR